MTIAAIAQRTGHKPDTLRLHIRRLGIQPRESPRGPYYDLTAAEERRVLAALAAARVGWPKGRKRDGRRGPAVPP